MISPQIENLIRQKVRQFNVMVGSQPQPGQPGAGAGMNEGGMPVSGIPVTMGGGDNMKANFKSGEYILSVPAVIGLGVKAGATSPGDALAIGKHLLDKLQMELKKEVGNDNPPRNADPAVIGKAGGFAEGGMFAGATDWIGKNVIDPARQIIQSIPGKLGIPATPAPMPAPAPLQPGQLGTGYLNNSATAAQTHNQAIQEAGGYAEGGGVEDVNIGKPAYPGATVMPFDRNAGSGVAGDMSQKTGMMASHSNIGSATGDFVLPSPAAPVAKGIDTSTAPGAAPAPAAASPSPSPGAPAVSAVDPHGFAQIGKQKVNYADIGTAQDPFVGKTPVEHAKQFAPQYHGTADETPQKVDPTIWVGTGSTKSTMKESEAYAKGMMDPKQKADYEQKQMAEKELAAKSDLAKQTMGIKKEEADTKKSAAESLAAYHKQLGDAKTNFGKGVMSSLSPEAVHDLALSYAKTGNMPNMGMGGKEDRDAVFNEWSKMMHNSGGSVGEQLEARSALKASQTALNNDEKQFDLMEKSEKQAAGAAKLLRESSKNYNRTPIKSLNAVEAYFRGQVNNPELSDFQMKLLAFTREYYKVTTNAYASARELSIGAQEQADKLLNTSDSYASLEAKIKAAEQEMTNTRSTFKETIDTRKADIAKAGEEHKTAAAGGKPLTPDIASQYFAKYGSKQAAQEAAKKDGYTW